MKPRQLICQKGNGDVMLDMAKSLKMAQLNNYFFFFFSWGFFFFSAGLFAVLKTSHAAPTY